MNEMNSTILINATGFCLTLKYLTHMLNTCQSRRVNSKLEGHNLTPNPDFASVGDIGKTQTSESWLPFFLFLQSPASTECALQRLDMLCNVLTYVRTFCWRTVIPTSVTRCSIAPYLERSIAWIAAVIVCVLYASIRVKCLIVHLVVWL